MRLIVLTYEEAAELDLLKAGHPDKVTPRAGRTGLYYVNADVLTDERFAYAHEFLADKSIVEAEPAEVFE